MSELQDEDMPFQSKDYRRKENEGGRIMENYFCANSVEEQVDYLTDKVKDIITNKLDKASIVQETGTGTDVVMSQKAVTDAIANKGLDTLTGVDLTVGNTTVQYDTTNGIQINSTARFTDAAGNHDATMDLDLPVVGTDGIVIDKAADSEKIEVSGKNLIKDPYPGVNNTGAKFLLSKADNNTNWGMTFIRNSHSLVENADGSELVGYGTKGEIYAKNTINDDYSVTNKKYVDDNFLKVYNLGVIGPGEVKFPGMRGDTGTINEEHWFATCVGEWVANSAIALTDAQGHLGTNTPTADKHCANKKYVDDNFTPAYSSSLPVLWGGQLICYNNNTYGRCGLDSGTNEYTAVLRDAGGQINLPEIPTKDYNAVCKKYVDDAIASISPTTQTKYQHNLVLEGTKLGDTIKAFMSIPRSDNTTFGTLDEIVSALGDAYISCTGYIYDGNQKSHVIVAFNTAGPGFEYNDPETGGQVYTIANDDVTVTDNVLEF